MPNYLKMPKKSQVLALLELGWSYRRIEAETGVRRETVSRYDRMRRANAAKTFPGSDRVTTHRIPLICRTSTVQMRPKRSPARTQTRPKRSPARRRARGSPPRVYRTAIAEKLDAGLSLQRIWQDLVEEYGYGASYESVKRFVRTLAPTRRAVGVFHCAPGAEGQVDFFRGAPTLDAATGEWRRPWVFRMTLGHSRHGYEEAVWDQKLETFLRLHERAFRDLGGVPAGHSPRQSQSRRRARVLLRSGQSRGLSRVRRSTGASRRCRRSRARPQENGKQERSGGYVKDNALKGRTLRQPRRAECVPAALESHHRAPAHSRHDAPPGLDALRRGRAAGAAAARRAAFPFFTAGERTVHTDGHVEVGGAFYPVPLALLGPAAPRAAGTRTWCASSTATRSSPCTRGSRPACLRRAPARPRPPRGSRRLSIGSSASATRVGPALKQWADAALAARGVRAIRLIQGVLGLTRRHPRERVLAAVTEAHAHQHFRYQTIRRLVERTPAPPRPTLVTDDPAIRPMTQYTLEDFLR